MARKKIRSLFDLADKIQKTLVITRNWYNPSSDKHYRYECSFGGDVRNTLSEVDSGNGATIQEAIHNFVKGIRGKTIINWNGGSKTIRVPKYLAVPRKI